jgi:hypothetical protein
MEAGRDEVEGIPYTFLSVRMQLVYSINFRVYCIVTLVEKLYKTACPRPPIQDGKRELMRAI